MAKYIGLCHAMYFLQASGATAACPTDQWFFQNIISYRKLDISGQVMKKCEALPVELDRRNVILAFFENYLQ